MSPCDFQAKLKSPLKTVGTHHYVHLDGFDLLPADATSRLVAAESLAQVTRGDRYNVARFDNSHNRVALLNYPNFFEDAFPALHESANTEPGDNGLHCSMDGRARVRAGCTRADTQISGPTCVAELRLRGMGSSNEGLTGP